MGLFKEIAEPLVARGVPVIPLRPKTKIAFLQGWETLATTDSAKIEQWDEEYQNANGACVAYARPDGVWFLEIDKPGYAQVIEEETGQKIPQTFVVRSSPGRGHFYFKQTPASIAMGNVQGKDTDGKESWSARVDNRYVVAPGSYHPTSGLRYETLLDTSIVPAPDWLVHWCISKKTASTVESPRRTGHIELDSEEPISEGGRNSALASILGKARQVLGMQSDELFAYGLSVNQKRCRPPLPESEVRTIANSIGRYEVKQAPPVIMGGQVLSAIQPVTAITQEDLKPVEVKAIPYPSFPRWVIKGTSIGDGLVNPICAVNNSYPEFIFMPAMALMLNYAALKVRIKDRNTIPSMYMVSIGWKGLAFKSTGVQEAIDYLGAAGMVNIATDATRNAEGKTLVWTAGSTEGLGQAMKRTTCKNAVLFYDEFSTFVEKASIEGSSMMGHVLSMYESRLFSNVKSGRKENFEHEPGKYCATILACTTDRGFSEQWARLPKVKDSGLEDRFFLLYQPETALPVKSYTYVNTVAGTIETKARMAKAVEQGEYEISDTTMIDNENIPPRAKVLVEKIALFFAIDRGLKEIDESCIERALAIVKYGLAVKKYLRSFESTSRESALQGQIIQFLQRHGGVTTQRELNRALHPMKYGTYMWARAYSGLVQGGWIAESGAGKKGEPLQIILLRLPEEEE